MADLSVMIFLEDLLQLKQDPSYTITEHSTERSVWSFQDFHQSQCSRGYQIVSFHQDGRVY